MSSLSSIADPADLSGRRAAKGEAQVQARAAQQSTAELRRQFDVQQARTQPLFEQAAPAISQLAGLAGAQGFGVQQGGFNQFMQSPEQQLLQQSGMDAINRNQMAVGNQSLGVNAALQERGQGLSQQDFQNYLARLGSIAGIAQNTGSQLGQYGQSFAEQLGGLNTIGAQAKASGISGQQAGMANLANQAAGIAGLFWGNRNV